MNIEIIEKIQYNGSIIIKGNCNKCKRKVITIDLLIFCICDGF